MSSSSHIDFKDEMPINFSTNFYTSSLEKTTVRLALTVNCQNKVPSHLLAGKCTITQ